MNHPPTRLMSSELTTALSGRPCVALALELIEPPWGNGEPLSAAEGSVKPAAGKRQAMPRADFEAARVEGYRTIEITDFVPYEQVDRIYFARTYHLGLEQCGEKVLSKDELIEALSEAA